MRLIKCFGGGDLVINKKVIIIIIIIVVVVIYVYLAVNINNHSYFCVNYF